MTIELKSHQNDHFIRILNILDEWKYYMDFSRMGLGKTYIAGKLSQVLDLRLLVICPVAASPAWKTLEKYGVEIIDIISYQSLRGTEKYQPSHGYLERETITKYDIKGNERKKTRFYPTDKFLDLVDDGILLIFDEGQMLKNNSDQYKAAYTLSMAIAAAETRSKCGFLSGSPYDKEEHSVNILRFLSIIRSKKLIQVNPHTKEKTLKGLNDLTEFCNELDKDMTSDILSEYGENISVKQSREISHKLFSKLISPYLSSEMPPEECPYKINMEEAYLILGDKELKELKNGISDLADATRFVNGEIDTKQLNWGKVTLAMKSIEKTMIPSTIRFAKKILNENKSAKVIICVTYLDNLDMLVNSLSSYGVVSIDGSIPSKERIKRVDNFNTKDSIRVFISTIKTGGVSISLHDTDGRYPRHMLCIPTYSIIDIYQACGRINRTGLKSDASFYMIYGTNKDPKGSVKVTPILNALIRKKDVLKSLITEQCQIYKLPGEFPITYYES